MPRCDLCWFEFPDEEALAAHVEMEESVDWPLDGITNTEEGRCPAS